MQKPKVTMNSKVLFSYRPECVAVAIIQRKEEMCENS